MSRKRQGEIDFEQLKDFLIKLGFEQPAAINHSLAFHHRESGTVLVLSVPKGCEPVRPADVLSVLLRLESADLVSETDLQQLRLGSLPKAS